MMDDVAPSHQLASQACCHIVLPNEQDWTTSEGSVGRYGLISNGVVFFPSFFVAVTCWKLTVYNTLSESEAADIYIFIYVTMNHFCNILHLSFCVCMCVYECDCVCYLQPSATICWPNLKLLLTNTLLYSSCCTRQVWTTIIAALFVYSSYKDFCHSPVHFIKVFNLWIICITMTSTCPAWMLQVTLGGSGNILIFR